MPTCFGPDCPRARPARPRAALRRGIGLLAVALLPAPLSAQRSAGPAPRPEFRSLRFEETWDTRLSDRWDDRIKHLPLAGTRPLYATLGGQVRWREELFRAFNTGPQHDDHAQSRVLLSADVVAGSRARRYARLFGEWRDAQSYGRTLPGGARPADLDRHDVQNLFAEVGRSRSFLRVGRQEITFGRERLIGVPDWANTRRGAQGLRLQLATGPLLVEAFDFRPVIVRQTRANAVDHTARVQLLQVGTAPGAGPARPAAWMPATWQLYHIDQRLTAPTSGHRRTSGGRVQWQGPWFGPGTSSLEFESAWQHGALGVERLRAWFWVGEAQYQWRRATGAPALAFGVEEASGERPTTGGTREAFTALYPAAHAHGGYADVVGRTNVREWHLLGTWAPHRTVDLRGVVYRFDRRSRVDGVYTKQTTLFRAADPNAPRHVADEIDLTGTWKPTRHWRAIAGGALVRPGAFLRQTGNGAQTERWGFVGTSYTF